MLICTWEVIVYSYMTDMCLALQQSTGTKLSFVENLGQ